MLKNLKAGLEFLKKTIIDELSAQGHNASGKLLKSIETVVEEKGEALVGKILMNDYSIFLDKGVTADRVPYTRGSGAKRSKYIDALIEWSRYIKPSLAEKERKSFAFAVAHTAKQEGHPTRGSYAFSDNGRRKAFYEHSVEKNMERFLEILDLGSELQEAIDIKLNDLTKRAA